ncbi:MAG: energy-coupling factor transporter ATPase [Nitrospirales bacterium]
MDLASVWQDTRLIVITVQIAAIYAAILIPFKAGIPIIPGFVELRPANAIPIVASLLFGPAAAWGAGIGNVIGDCFGTLGPASFFGFWGNFFFGYLPYLLWGHLGWLSSGGPPLVSTMKQGVEYTLICILASAACAGIIGWGVEALGLLPFVVLAPAIFFNNIVMGLLLGPPLLRFLYPRVQRWKLRFEDIQGALNRVQSLKGVKVNQGEKARLSHSHLSAESHTSVLECSHLSFQYAGAVSPIFTNLSFSVSRAELVMVLGSSGTGKSTLTYACNGLIPHLIPGHYSGEISVMGRPTVNDPVWAQAGRVGMVFQDFDAQLVASTADGELRHPLEYRDPPLSVENVMRRIHDALCRVGLHIGLDRDPMTLSGGQRQRLVLASVLAQTPSVLVLDEPGSDLDPAGCRQLREVLLQVKQEGLALLVTERDYENIDYADRLLVLGKEAMAWTGPPEELLRQPQLMRKLGLRPLALTECFEGIECDQIPISVEEAWDVTDALHVSLHPPPSVLNDELRLGMSHCAIHDRSLSVIQVEAMSFGYDGQEVLHDLSFSIRSGEFLAIVGANGSGKSTLARLLNGLLVPTGGRIVVSGMDTRWTAMKELAQRVGLVFQNPDHQIFAETAWEEVAFSLRNFGYDEQDIESRVKEALAAVGFAFDASREQDPFSLRKGERQRLAVASVLASRPEILIFDEPTTGLDAIETDRMMEMIQNLNREGHTVVMITHSMRLVAQYATHCFLMKDGRIVGEGHPREVFGHHEWLHVSSLTLPAISQFSQRWGCTLLTVEEVRASFSFDGAS